ncbi:hypothetical protein QTP86_000569 [Hemibagrus guttatus]|nr:hypothetical protein QTP86_000569 [Hemibagrus guttatus]
MAVTFRSALSKMAAYPGVLMAMTISPDLLPFITTVINGSLTSGHVPTAFKKDRVIPILKKPALDLSDISNYRPEPWNLCNSMGMVCFLPGWSLISDTTASARISACLVDISSWMMAHQLKLNPSKTELLAIAGTHLRPLHEVNVNPSHKEDSANMEKSCLTNSSPDRFFLDKPSVGGRVMLKVVPVNLHYEDHTLDIFALLDDGSERTILLSTAVKALGIQGVPEELPLRTVRDDIQVLNGSSISFQISPLCKPQTRYKINHAFTAERLNLSLQSYPVEQLQQKYRHLRGLPIRTLTDVQPLLLIGSDQPHLTTPTEPVRWGGPGAPAAVHTRLGWTLQGPIPSMGCTAARQCLLTSMALIQDELFQNVQRLWQLDTVPQWEGKEVTRSKQDQDAFQLLEMKTLTLEIEGINRLATPLLRRKDMPLLNAPMESVLLTLRSVERRLLKDPIRAEVYKEEMRKLLETGAVREVVESIPGSPECWYIPHHIVSHNGKFRIVFNCSHQYQGQSLNQYLLPGPTLSASLLGVLIRFREHPVAVSGDIKAMFHQIRLFPEDRPLLRFLWRDLKMDETPKILEWQVLPFGTTSSPCCATYALQRHVRQHPQMDEAIRFLVERCFYVDNCLQSLPTADAARNLIDQLRNILSGAGFEIRQWASNDPGVLSHLPSNARAVSVELWLTQEKSDIPESTLGLSWNWQRDTLSYKHRPVVYETPTLRNIYKVLATQYDPLGWLLPFTTRAKVIVKQLWNKQRGWDDPNLPPELLQSWNAWEEELQYLPCITFPRPYVPVEVGMELPMRCIFSRMHLSRHMERWLTSGLLTRKVGSTCPLFWHAPVSLLNKFTPFQGWNSAIV